MLSGPEHAHVEQLLHSEGEQNRGGISESGSGSQRLVDQEHKPALNPADGVEADSSLRPPTEPESHSRAADAADTESGSVLVSPHEMQVSAACSFAEFCRTHWINSDGQAVPAPWVDPAYSDSLVSRALEAWEHGRAWHAYLLARTAADIGRDSRLDVSELEAAARLLSDAQDLVRARSAARLSALRDRERPVKRTAAISLTMEALAPTLPVTLSASEIDHLIERSELHAPAVASVVRFLLNGWAAAADPVQLLRTQLDQLSSMDPQTLANELRNAERKLQETVTSLYSAAGGRIQRTHCRKAWADFINSHVVPLRIDLAPLSNERARHELSAAEARVKVVDLGRAFQRIMENAGVRHQDLSAALSAAEQIVAAIEQVVDSRSRVEQVRRKPPVTLSTVPVAEMKLLLEETPSHSSEHICALLLRAGVTRTPQANPLLLPSHLLLSYPNLLRMIRPAALASPTLIAGVDVHAVTDLLGASAIVSGEIPEDSDPAVSTSHLLTRLRDRAADLARVDLLAALSLSNVLQSQERTQLHRKALEAGDEAYDLARQLEKAWLDCDELMHPEASKFGDIAREALAASSGTAGETGQSVLLSEWLKAQVQSVRVARSHIAEVRTLQARQRSSEIGEEFAAHAAAGNYRAAMALLNPALPTPDLKGGTVRRTLWRGEALDAFPRPTLALERDLKGSTPDQSLLVHSWAAAAASPSFPDRDSIRKAFYAVISGEAGKSQDENRRRFLVKLTELRDHSRTGKTVINSAVIREYFRRARINPTFLPQIADFKQIVITSIGVGQTSNALDAISRAVGQEPVGTLFVFLEPGLPTPKRDEICAGLRRRNLPAAIIDDIDVCRLCAVANDVETYAFVPFLEVVFEQLDLEMVSPFSSLDGQHIRMETFIGRAQEASRIALNSNYTRIFSGRKLGKSAFLRYVANSFDQTKAPSGNTLNVIFITIAGGESEAWVVDCIINEMSGRFQLMGEMEQSTRLAAADRFSRYAKRFTDARPSENVLLILDEADAFVEGQLRAYDEDREGSLSFRMMKELPTRVDSAGMPRIRIVFSGYRITNTRGGVWANAGDVLILKPLTEDEAVEFLRGMLGRVGVDIGSHAPFAARRCGYQPAVLIRFGDSLLRRIRRNSRSGKRESYVVSYDDVLATMNEQSVLDEIRTVVANNFQGNRAAAAIFGATLLALKDLEPGMSLEDGPSQVLSKIADIDADVGWLTRFGPQPLAQIERQLQEFIERELLSVSDAPRFGVREYRLKFPHFLPVLTQHTEVAGEVRLHIEHLRTGTQATHFHESVLPDASLDALRYWHSQEDIGLCSLVAVGSQWTFALTDGKVGVADRLGCNPPMVCCVDGATDVRERVAAGYRVFSNVTSDSWSQFRRASPRAPLTLIGGIDLQRSARANLFAQDPVPVEAIRAGRMAKTAVVWWFEVVRALHFKSADAIDRIWDVTQGVPVLVGAMNRLLPQHLASDVSTVEVSEAITALRADIPKIAEQLVSGPPEVRLSPREIELLRMAHRVGSEVEQDFDLEKDLPEYWELVASQADGGLRAPLTDKEDQIAFQVLLDVGLLAASSKAVSKGGSALGRVQIDAGNVVVDLVAALETASVG